MEKRKPDFDCKDNKDCLTCKGTGIYVSEAFTSLEGKEYPRTERDCSSCNGRKVWPSPDYEAIMASLISSKGKNKGGLRASPPVDPYRCNRDPNQLRSYYVWRLARFHGGKDVTMPMSAMSFLRGDPYEIEMDAMADFVARKLLGTNMAAAYRWGNALGGNYSVPADMPATAHPNGPVADGNKPPWEKPEIDPAKE